VEPGVVRGIFKQINGNKCLHKINNGNGVGLVNVSTFGLSLWVQNLVSDTKGGTLA
jgi:hypothetical protein